jgi:hypothetical protein
MKICQSLKSRANTMKLVNFVQNRFKSHGYAPFMGLREGELQMDCLASEDLKEEKVVTTPITIVPRPNLLDPTPN